MKRYMKLVLLLILVVLIAMIAIFYTKSNISRKEILGMLENKVTNNMYSKVEIFYENQNEPEAVIEMYIKDNKLYKRETNTSFEAYQEILYDFENKTQVNIDNKMKGIGIYPIDDSDNPLLTQLNAISDTIEKSKEKYKYYGKETADETECIKFSLTDAEKAETFYYLDIENKNIIKTEQYNSQNKIVLKTIYTYSYNTVTDNDILDFDINNYPDYNVDNVLDKK